MEGEQPKAFPDVPNKYGRISLTNKKMRASKPFNPVATTLDRRIIFPGRAVYPDKVP